MPEILITMPDVSKNGTNNPIINVTVLSGFGILVGDNVASSKPSAYFIHRIRLNKHFKYYRNENFFRGSVTLVRDTSILTNILVRDKRLVCR